MDSHIVLRDFSGPKGKRYTSGQVVDATAWPNVRALVNSHYIRPRTVQDVSRETQARPIRQKG